MPELGKKVLKYELKKDKWYLFHVKRADGTVVVVRVLWNDEAWNLFAHNFDRLDQWYGGLVFLYFATAKK